MHQTQVKKTVTRNLNIYLCPNSSPRDNEMHLLRRTGERQTYLVYISTCSSLMHRIYRSMLPARLRCFWHFNKPAREPSLSLYSSLLCPLFANSNGMVWASFFQQVESQLYDDVEALMYTLNVRTANG